MSKVERPILFSGPMVRAILAGRKTQTRRVVKPAHGFEHHNILKVGMPHAYYPWTVWWHGEETDRVGCMLECPFGKPGDRLWVRETWRRDDWKGNIAYGDGTIKDTGLLIVRYAADNKQIYQKRPNKPVPVTPEGAWRPSIFMFRELSRITLEIVDVRAERLSEISEEDAKAEGIQVLPLQSEDDPSAWYQSAPGVNQDRTARGSFIQLWDSINGKRAPWASSPWVWVVEFKLLERKVEAE